MSDYIPTELLAEILVRLPVESLIRNTSICKPWHSLITSPSFIAKHLNRSKTNTENLLLTTYTYTGNRESYLLCRGDEKFGDEFAELESPFSTSLGQKRIVGSCNGSVFMIDFDTLPRRIILWNPIIRKSVTLPMPPSLPETSPLTSPFVFGFGAHPITHEYMLVLIVHEMVDLKQLKFPSKVELYTQGTGSWRSIASVGHPHMMAYICGLQAFVNGVIHWIALERIVADHCIGILILLFDMGSQAFSEMVMPAALVNDRGLSVPSIMSYRESLAVLRHGKDSCSIWVMKEYGVAESWAKLHTITFTGVFGHIIRFRENGKVLVSTSDNRLLSYDCETKTFANSGYTGSVVAFAADTFKESLVLVKPWSGVSRGS